MIHFLKKIGLLYFLLITGVSYAQNISFSKNIVPGAWQTESYFPLLKGQNVAVVSNQTSLVNDRHLIDTLIISGINIKLVFAPEHGFRGEADAGEIVNNNKDKLTGLPVVSLYGKKKKPSQEDLADIDIVVFDIQDVGVRFYTYLSTLHYVMEACAESNIPLLVLDRPNPNGFYVDGPVLDTNFKSFVGMHPVPVVYGMTIGEYALMINGEHWLNNGVECDISIVKCKNYKHNKLYNLPVKPSPNLPNYKAVFLYPSLAFFEGTIVSVGRGTDFPFQVYGYPELKKGNTEFTPESKNGAKNPKFLMQKCKGVDLRNTSVTQIVSAGQINMSYLINTYHNYKGKQPFFNSFFTLLAGTDKLQKQIERGMSEQDIRASWQKDIGEFMQIRGRYLLYK